MSWDQLVAIQREAAAMDQTEFAESCPNDGEPYRVGPDGARRCPFDGYSPGD